MRKLLAIFLLLVATSAFGQAATALLSAATATGASTGVEVGAQIRTFQASGTTSAGAGAATIKIQASNAATPAVDGDWVDLGTITLTLGTTKTGDGFVSDAPWRRIRANVTAISGTGASVDVLMKGK